MKTSIDGVLMVEIDLSETIVFDLCDRCLYLAWKVPTADHGKQKQRLRCRLNILWIQVVEPGTYESGGG